MLPAQSTSNSVWFLEQSSTEARSKEEGIFGKLAGLSMLEEAEVAMQVKAATKIQAIARARARKQENAKTLKASHARLRMLL